MTKNTKIKTGQRFVGGHVEKRLQPEMRDYIGQNLRTLYQRVVEEPVPEKFIELLKQLDAKDDGE